MLTEATSQQPLKTFLMLSTAMYYPWDSLNMFFFLSMIFMDPFGCHSPISPAFHAYTITQIHDINQWWSLLFLLFVADIHII